MTSADSGGFFSRWSRNKQAQRDGRPLPEPSSVPVQQGHSPRAAAGQPVRSAQQVCVPEPQAVPPPTLQDAQALTPASDFKPFMAPQVSPAVKSAAMKRLFADPHFNVMDGLDIYISDYGQPDPIPLDMLRQMNGAQFLRLFDDPQNPPAAAPSPSPSPDTAPVPRAEGSSFVGQDAAAASLALSPSQVPEPPLATPGFST